MEKITTPTYPKNQPYFAFLVECIGKDDQAPAGDAERVAYCFERFENEHGWNAERVGLQTALADWLAGCALHIPCYNGEVLELAVRMGGLSATATDDQQDTILLNYYAFMANKLIKLKNWHDARGVKV